LVVKGFTVIMGAPDTSGVVMAVTGSVEIKRSPQEVFVYLADPSRRPEWQEAVERIEMVEGTPEGLGARVRETRTIQGTARTFTWEVTEYEPGRSYGLRGIDGPVRTRVLMTLSPVDGGTRTSVETEISFKGVGIGMAFARLASLGARKEAASYGEHLKEQLEAPLT